MCRRNEKRMRRGEYENEVRKKTRSEGREEENQRKDKRSVK